MGWTWGRCLGLLDADFPRSSDQTLGTGQDRNFQWQLNPCGIDSTLKMKPMEPPKSWVYGLEDAEIRTRISEFEVPSSIWIIWGCVRLSQFAAIEMTRVLSCCFFLCFSDFMWALMWGLNWGGSLGIFLPPGMTAGSKYSCPMAGFEGRPIRQAERELMRLKEHGGMAMMAAVGWFPELFQFWDTLGIRDTPEFQDVSSVSNPDPNRSGHFCFEPLHVGVHGEQTCSTGSLGASFYLSLSAAKTMAKIWPKITEVLGHLELLSLSWYLERILWYTIHTHIITYIYI